MAKCGLSGLGLNASSLIGSEMPLYLFVLASDLSEKWYLRCDALVGANPADFIIGGIDRANLFVGDVDHFLRQAARDQLVRVVFHQQLAVMAAQLLVGGVRRNAEDVIRALALGG